MREATMVAGGAVLAMIAVLFRIGPGTIFPIVIAFGAVVIGGATRQEQVSALRFDARSGSARVHDPNRAEVFSRSQHEDAR